MFKMSDGMPIFDPERTAGKAEQWICLAVVSPSHNAAWTIKVDKLGGQGAAGQDEAAGSVDVRAWVSDQMWASALADMLERALESARLDDPLAPKAKGSKSIGVFKWEGVSVAIHGLYIDCSAQDWPKWRDWMASGLSARLGAAVAPPRDEAATWVASWKELAEECVGAAEAAWEARTLEESSGVRKRMGPSKSAKAGRI